MDKEKYPFNEILVKIKDGERVCRSGWNDKGMFLFLVPGSKISVSDGRPLSNSFPIGTEIECLPYIMMKTADNKIVPWIASQTDILSDDWMVI